MSTLQAGNNFVGDVSACFQYTGVYPSLSECVESGSTANVSKDNLWCLICRMCVCVCSQGDEAPCDEMGPKSTKEPQLESSTPPRGVDRVLSRYDTTDMWCAICIIVHVWCFYFIISFSVRFR